MRRITLPLAIAGSLCLAATASARPPWERTPPPGTIRADIGRHLRDDGRGETRMARGSARPETFRGEKPKRDDSYGRRSDFRPPINSQIQNRLTAAGAGLNVNLMPSHVKQDGSRRPANDAYGRIKTRCPLPIKASLVDKAMKGQTMAEVEGSGVVHGRIGHVSSKPAGDLMGRKTHFVLPIKNDIIIKLAGANKSVEPKPGKLTPERFSSAHKAYKVQTLRAHVREAMPTESTFRQHLSIW